MVPVGTAAWLADGRLETGLVRLVLLNWYCHAGTARLMQEYDRRRRSPDCIIALNASHLPHLRGAVLIVEGTNVEGTTRRRPFPYHGWQNGTYPRGDCLVSVFVLLSAVHTGPPSLHHLLQGDSSSHLIEVSKFLWKEHGSHTFVFFILRLRRGRGERHEKGLPFQTGGSLSHLLPRRTPPSHYTFVCRDINLCTTYTTHLPSVLQAPASLKPDDRLLLPSSQTISRWPRHEVKANMRRMRRTRQHKTNTHLD